MKEGGAEQEGKEERGWVGERVKKGGREGCVEGWRDGGREGRFLNTMSAARQCRNARAALCISYIFFRIVANSNCNNVFAIRVHKMDFIFSALCDDTDRCTSKVQNFIDKDCYYECL